MDMNTTALPALKAVTATDQGGVLAIAASMGLVFAFLSLFVRAYVRIECRAMFSRDDYACFSSMAVMVLETGIVFGAISHGFGRTVNELTNEEIHVWQLDIFVADLFYLAAMWLTKCAIVLLLMRLSRHPTHMLVSYIILATSTAYFVISIFAVTIRCNPKQPWITEGHPKCPSSMFTRWSAITGMDVITEVALFSGSMFLVRDLQLSWSKKAVVILAYGLRIPVIAFAIVRLYFLHRGLYSNDMSLNLILGQVFTQIELGYAVTAATMPCLRPFMSALNTQYGGGPACIIVNQSIVTNRGRSHNASAQDSTATQTSTVARRSTESAAQILDHKVATAVSQRSMPEMTGALNISEENKVTNERHLSSSASSANSNLDAHMLDAQRVGEAV